jgi:hypothetical protein
MKVGNRTIISRERFIIPQGEKAEFEIDYKDTKIKLTIQFHLTPARPPEMGSAMWNSDGENINITFTTLSATPVIVRGKSALGDFEDGSRLTFFAEISRYASNGVVFIQLMNE